MIYDINSCGIGRRTSNFLIVFSVRPCSRFVLAFNDVVQIKFYDRNHCFGHMVALAGREKIPHCADEFPENVASPEKMLPAASLACWRNIWFRPALRLRFSACSQYTASWVLMPVWTVDVHVYSVGRHWRWNNKDWRLPERPKKKSLFVYISWKPKKWKLM